MRGRLIARERLASCVGRVATAQPVVAVAAGLLGFRSLSPGTRSRPRRMRRPSCGDGQVPTTALAIPCRCGGWPCFPGLPPRSVAGSRGSARGPSVPLSTEKNPPQTKKTPPEKKPPQKPIPRDHNKSHHNRAGNKARHRVPPEWEHVHDKRRHNPWNKMLVPRIPLHQNIPRPVYSRFTQKQTQVLRQKIIVQRRRNTKKTNTNTKNQQNNDR